MSRRVTLGACGPRASGRGPARTGAASAPSPPAAPRPSPRCRAGRLGRRAGPARRRRGRARRSPVTAASTVSSWVATWRRSSSANAAGDPRPVAPADPVAVDHADRLDDRVAGEVGALPGVGQVQRDFPPRPGEERIDDGRDQLARRVRRQRARRRRAWRRPPRRTRPGAARAARSGVSSMPQSAPQPERSVSTDGRNSARCRSPAAGRAPHRSSSVRLSTWRRAKSSFGEGRRRRPSGGGHQRRQPADVIDQLPQHGQAVGAVDVEGGDDREVVDARDRRPHRSQRAPKAIATSRQ